MRINWDLIKNDYIQSEGKISLQDLATKFNVNCNTLRSKKARDRWDDIDPINATENATEPPKVQKPIKHYATVQQKNATVDNKLNNNENLQHAGQNNATEAPAGTGLTGKQLIFCHELLIDFNATRAAIAAGYSKKTARSIASELLTKPNISAEITKMRNEMIIKVDVNREKILMEYMKIAFSDITNYMDVGRKKKLTVNDKGKKIYIDYDYANLKHGDLMEGGPIQEIRITENGTSLKMHDKMKALEVLSKYNGFMEDDNKRLIEIEKLKLYREQLKLAQARGTNAVDKGNLDLLIDSINNIDLNKFDTPEVTSND
jgi:phage terminase small subunit